MADIQKPRRRTSGFMEGPDQVLRLNSLYRLDLFGGRRGSELTHSGHEDLGTVSPDPLEDLDDSDIGDHERRAAIARERWRRQRRG